MFQRLRALRSRHSILEAKIQSEQGRPAPDSMQIMVMKRLRLKLRDEISKLETRLSPQSVGKRLRSPAAV